MPSFIGDSSFFGLRQPVKPAEKIYCSTVKRVIKCGHLSCGLSVGNYFCADKI